MRIKDRKISEKGVEKCTIFVRKKEKLEAYLKGGGGAIVAWNNR
jgi:hypothetical protein